MLLIKPFQQFYSYDCGGAVFASLLHSYGLGTFDTIKEYRSLLKKIHCGIDGLSMVDMVKALNSYGLKTKQYKYKKYYKLSSIINNKNYPVIVCWHSTYTHAPHYSIVVDVEMDSITLMDPNFKEYSHLIDRVFYDNWFFIKKDCSEALFKKNPEKCVEIRPAIVIEQAITAI